MVLLCAMPALHAQPDAATPSTRQMSLNDCLRMALEQNLDIKIGRSIPQIAQLSLDGSYGYYDPLLASRAQQNYSSRPGKLDPNVGAIPGSQTWNEDFTLGLTGRLPTGAHYELSSHLNRLSGDTIVNGTNIGLPFQYSPDTAITVTQPLLKNFWIDDGRMQIKLAKKTSNAPT